MNKPLAALALVLIAASCDSFAQGLYNQYDYYQQQHAFNQQREAAALERQAQIMQQQQLQQQMYYQNQQSNAINNQIAHPYTPDIGATFYDNYDRARRGY